MATRSAARARTTPSRIVRDPQVLGGEPTIAGTRTSVRSIVLAARDQGTVAGVLAAYPHLRARDVAEALAFYHRHQAEVDASIAANRDTDTT